MFQATAGFTMQRYYKRYHLMTHPHNAQDGMKIDEGMKINEENALASTNNKTDMLWEIWHECANCRTNLIRREPVDD